MIRSGTPVPRFGRAVTAAHRDWRGQIRVTYERPRGVASAG